MWSQSQARPRNCRRPSTKSVAKYRNRRGSLAKPSIRPATQPIASASCQRPGPASEISSAIASAVEQQGAATQEISRNVQQAAEGTQLVSSNIVDVQRGATETGSASTQVLSAAQSLSSESTHLRHEVDRFLSTVRA